MPPCKSDPQTLVDSRRPPGAGVHSDRERRVRRSLAAEEIGWTRVIDRAGRPEDDRDPISGEAALRPPAHDDSGWRAPRAAEVVRPGPRVTRETGDFMNESIRRALEEDRVIDVTTLGRSSGEPRCIEIWFFRVRGRIYLTGAPGRARDWYRNLLAHPRFTFHLKQSARADLPATAVPIVERGERETILRELLKLLKPGVPAEWMPGLSDEARAATDESFAKIASDPEAVLPRWLDESPLVEVQLESNGPATTPRG